MTTYDIDKKMGRNETSGFYKGQFHIIRLALGQLLLAKVDENEVH